MNLIEALPLGILEGVIEWRSFSPFRLWLPPGVRGDQGSLRDQYGGRLLAHRAGNGVGDATIAWLLRFVAKHSITVFIEYRVALAAVIAVLLGTGMLSPT